MVYLFIHFVYQNVKLKKNFMKYEQYAPEKLRIVSLIRNRPVFSFIISIINRH